MFKFIYQTAIIVVVVVAVAFAIKFIGDQSAEELAQTVREAEAKCLQGDKDACSEAETAKAKAKELSAEEYVIYMTKLGLALEAE